MHRTNIRTSKSPTFGRHGQALNLIFSRYDIDNHQQLDYPEIKRLLTDVFVALGRQHPTPTDIKNFVSAVDLNGNGIVTRAKLARVFNEIGRMTQSINR